MRRAKQSRLLCLAVCASLASLSRQASAVITFSGAFNLGASPGNLGIYEGTYNGSYAGTPLTSTAFITAAHIFAGPTNTFVYNNNTSTTTTYNVQVVATLDDVAIWQIAPNQSATFTLTAPLYTGSSELNSSIVDVGRGYGAGGAVMGGFAWGGGQGTVSWGTNTINGIIAGSTLDSSGVLGGDFLRFTFSNQNPSSPNYNPNEAIIAPFDSGGGVFINVGGQYQLAGINYAFDSVLDSNGNAFQGSLYDVFDYYTRDSQNNLVQITQHASESSYVSRVSTKLNFIGLADGSIPAASAAAHPINDSGTLIVYNNMTTGAITGGAALTIGSDGTVAKLQMAQNSGGSALSSLTLGHDSTLDLNNNHIIINYGIGADPINSIAAWVATGYANGAWNGTGIMSSMAQTNSASYGIGYADSADPGNPAGLASGTVEIKYTLLGDANLDGKVNGTDFAILATDFNQGGMHWDQGDFNYDGKVNGTDFADIASNFNQGASQSADMTALDAFAASNGLTSDVPEPSAALLIGIGAAGVLARRRPSAKMR